MNTTSVMKIFMVGDCEWWIGADAESVRQVIKDQCDYTDEDLKDYFSEVESEGLDLLKFTDCDEDERPTGSVRTFREQIEIEVAKGGDFPRLFAAVAW